MMEEKTILILDGEQRSALAATRSIGKTGMTVVVGSHIRDSIAGASKYCSAKVRYRPVFTDADGFIRDINSILDQYNINILLPMTDASVFTILRRRKELSDAVIIPVGTLEKYLSASDKNKLMRYANKLKIPIPKTIFIEQPEDISAIKGQLEFPVIIKPSMSIIHDKRKIKQVGVRTVNSEKEIKELMKKTETFKRPFMIQEKIIGEGLGVFALCDKGKAISVFSHRRLREKPPWGGVSVLSESTEPDPKARKYAIELLRGLKWDGVAMVEFKRDNRCGTPRLMEINARFWGSLQLSIDAGINFPALLMRQIKGEKLAGVGAYKKTKLRWLLGDVDALYIALKTSRKNKKLPPNFPSKTDCVIHFFKTFCGQSKFELLRRDDLRPFLCELKQYIKSLF